MVKANKSKVSDSDTLSWDQEDLDTAREREDWGGSFEAKPIGEYPCVVDEVERTTSEGDKTAGSPMYKLTLKITEGDYKGQKLFFRAIAHPKTGGTYLKMLKCCGYDTASLTSSAIPLPKPGSLEGHYLMGEITSHREYEGKTYENVNIKPLDGDAPASAGKGKKEKAKKATR